MLNVRVQGDSGGGGRDQMVSTAIVNPEHCHVCWIELCNVYYYDGFLLLKYFWPWIKFIVMCVFYIFKFLCSSSEVLRYVTLYFEPEYALWGGGGSCKFKLQSLFYIIVHSLYYIQLIFQLFIETNLLSLERLEPKLISLCMLIQMRSV